MAATVTKKPKTLPQKGMDIRINRVMGQIEGIRRMINGGRKTDDVVQQILAARQALSRIGLLILRDEVVKKSGDKNAKQIQQLLEKIFRV